MSFGSTNRARVLAILSLIAFALPSLAQITVATGSIIGTVTDSTGAVINGAVIRIRNLATGQAVAVSTNPSGAFSSGALLPGKYRVVISANGFITTETSLNVLVGNVGTLNVKLQVGSERDVLEVRASDSQINTEQATVQGVLNEDLIENLPVSGRNYLELAQLEPGIQIQDAANFGFGKDGYSSVSFGGRFGRTARVEVDGVDVSDEIFGSTTTNIPASAIQEFQLSQSSMDISTELTTSGAVNVTTRSGTNYNVGVSSAPPDSPDYCPAASPACIKGFLYSHGQC